MLRNNEAYLDALDAERIPDSTTAGDFTRRFKERDVDTLMECINTAREGIWKEKGDAVFEEALIDVDGLIAGTDGECKEGIDISYKGIWGYAPLIIALRNTKEVLYIKNRPGNVPSHDGSAEYIDRTIELVSPYAKRVCVFGDTDFSLTSHFDEWSEKADFVFGMDARKGLIEIAEGLSKGAWEALEREPKYEIKTKERRRPQNIKERIVRERGFENIKLISEEAAEFDYRPLKCEKTYRVVVVKKNLSIEKGEAVLFDDIKYFFYITTIRDLTKGEVVKLINGRCDQENVIEQLKNGVNAMRLPVGDLVSNWAYMVMAALAWNLKSWFGLLMPSHKRGTEVQKMEYRRFLNCLILIPAQIIRSGRKIIYRLLTYNDWLKDFFATWERIRQLKSA